jgi:putative transposase
VRPAPLGVMASQPRNEEAGAIYHVMARRVDRRRMFVDDSDYETYTRLMAKVTQRKGWHLLSFCLMPNHVHLMVETPDTNLGDGMRNLQSQYALAFNKRHCRQGTLFESRFKSPKIKTEAAFIRLVGYIAVNPVAAALCKRARDWPWGSDAMVAPPKIPPVWLAHERLLEQLEAMTGARCYHDLVAMWERDPY